MRRKMEGVRKNGKGRWEKENQNVTRKDEIPAKQHGSKDETRTQLTLGAV
jgi:hypothetical protein